MLSSICLSGSLCSSAVEKPRSRVFKHPHLTCHIHIVGPYVDDGSRSMPHYRLIMYNSIEFVTTNIPDALRGHMLEDNALVELKLS